MDGKTKKMQYIDTMEYYSAIRKDEMLPFVTTWVDLENIILSKVSQMEKVKTHMWVIKLKATMNKQDTQTLIDTDSSVVVTRGKGGWETH